MAEIVKIILAVFDIFLTLWKDRNDPEKARIRAAAQLTKDMNNDVETFKTAISNRDNMSISVHFATLSERVRRETCNSGDSVRQSGKSDPK